jgi:hypothetical protein
MAVLPTFGRVVAPWICSASIGIASLAGSAYGADGPASNVLQAMTPPSQTDPTLRIGAYFGALTPQALVTTVFEPWRVHTIPSYLIDAHAIYTFYRFDNLPIEFELEGGIAKRFGNNEGGDQVEFDLIPMTRWKYFPWNDYLYTNFRLGLIGASYVTGVSDFERQFDSSGHSARFLNFLVPEFTFAPSAASAFEVFVRVHHRSGIYGLIDHVYGASNYVAGGIRFAIY